MLNLLLMFCILALTTIFGIMQNDKCIVIDWPMAKAFVVVRSVTDVLFSLNILLQVCIVSILLCVI